MSALDAFTRTRLIRFVAAFKADHGRDASERDLTDAGFPAAVIDRLVRDGALTKYQVTAGTGNRENRYKLGLDPSTWRRI
ncbi:MAG: hypothetical protein NTY08_19185 [Proteobacteria bacterium]|nr:hypothetical protein [Pseudomonadota bacterium]